MDRSLWLIGMVVTTVILLGVLFALASRIQRYTQVIGAVLLGSPERGQTFFLALVFPGVVLHELAHAVMALLLGVGVTNVELFNPQPGSAGTSRLGAVFHPKTDILRGLLIGTAPLWAGCGILFGLLRLLQIPTPDFTQTLYPQDVVLAALDAVRRLPALTGWWFLAVAYLFFVVGNSVLLSPSDLTDLWPVIGVLLTLGAALFGLSFVIDLAQTPLAAFFTTALWHVLITAIFLFTLLIAANLVVFLPLFGVVQYLEKFTGRHVTVAD